MTPEQKQLITASFEALVPQAEETVCAFYDRLFHLAPSLRPMFQGSMKMQRHKFIGMLESAITSLEQLDDVVTVAWQLGKRHGGYGVRPEHYAVVGSALLGTLEQQLGPRFTPETSAAWAELYGLLSATMQQAAMEGIVPRPECAPQ